MATRVHTRRKAFSGGRIHKAPAHSLTLVLPLLLVFAIITSVFAVRMSTDFRSRAINCIGFGCFGTSTGNFLAGLLAQVTTPQSSESAQPASSPTMAPIDTCNQTCKKDSECAKGLACVYTHGFERGCRNKICQLSENCLCEGTTPPPGYTTPTAGPTGPDPVKAGTGQIVVGISSSFKNTAGIAPAQFTASGTTEPYASVTVTVLPDGIGGQTTANIIGRWEVPIPTKLSQGSKQLVVVAANAKGVQGEARMEFRVAQEKRSFPFGTVFAAMILVAIIFGGIIYWRQQNM